MSNNNVYLAELISTRLSHDLIGNIGAVANALELLNEGDDDDKEDISNILNFSSNVLTKRLKFFRLCFGLSNASVKSVDDLFTLANDYLSTLGNPNYPITSEFHISTPQIYKIILPALMTMADTIVKGGKIIVSQTENSILVQASSSVALNAVKLKNISQVIDGNEPQENPSSFAPLIYLLSYLSDSGVMVKLENDTLIIGA